MKVPHELSQLLNMYASICFSGRKKNRTKNNFAEEESPFQISRSINVWIKIEFVGRDVFADQSEKSESKDAARCQFYVLRSLACKDLSMNFEAISLI